MSTPSFKCQNCQCPIDMDLSLMDLSIAQRDMIVNSGGEPTNPSTFKIPPERLSRLHQVRRPHELTVAAAPGAAESYVFLQVNEDGLNRSKHAIEEESGEEEEDDSSKTLSSNIQVLTNIFNILSSKGNIDYPVCHVCCELMMQRLKAEYADAIRKRDAYFEFMDRLQKQHEKESAQEPKPASAEADLLAQKDELVTKLVALEHENDKLDKEIESLEQQLREKEQQETRAVLKQNLKDLEHIAFMKDMQSLKNQYELTLNNLDKLRKTNIFNETFRISHSGPFGTINDLRLGGFSQVRVPWQEINAAMGQLILLLATIAAKIHYELDGYRLKPLGSYSKVERFDPHTQRWNVYNAYSNDDFKIGKLFHKETSLDKALEAIIAIVDQIAKRISTLSRDHNDGGMELPYSMQKDKINGIPIKLLGSDPTLEWTTSCKFLLTNAKWLLAFSSQVT
ncbi:ACR154Wp [Eremothecium gossypii ATCC 10895]|uniref:ACR154Wp n=1 Tax=Eremothecium gossypii (strain ATCC 10895 / CBS 109.51 / FGSC 9923 / NRRL Y-1056) TaxID=284811 RepID=Q75BW7_EREGS|nr:ACR154Wp [Eremothecium gossypii ATCC 10895]AAS51380.1 ACR154Wp [Eremothecium gossypii ATCC 10895]